MHGSATIRNRVGARQTAGGVVSWIWERWNSAEPFVPTPRSQWPVTLRRIRLIGFLLIGAQFLALCVWSAVLVQRFALSQDFSTYEQAFYLISHGHLDPYATTLGYHFWQDHGSFILWPLAFLQLIWPHPTTLTWIQDAATAAAETVALAWACDLASIRAKKSASQTATWACIALLLLLLVPNPWIVWAASYVFHPEALATLCLVGAARDLFTGRRRVWVWLAFGLLTGDVGASYMGALGATAIIAGRRWWRTGLTIACLGFGWTIVLGTLGATKGSGLSNYAPLILGHQATLPDSTSGLTVAKAMVTHPGRVARAFWPNRVNAWANLSAGGLIGIAWPPVLVPVALVLLEGALEHGHQFALPGFQNMPVVILGAVGTVGICLALSDRLARYRRQLFSGLLLLLALNALGWTIVWLPRTANNWLRVTPGATATLRQLADKIGPGDEIVAQQGVVGGFASRPLIYPLFHLPTRFPVHARRVWLIFAPEQGSEAATPATILIEISRLAAIPGMHLAAASNGIFAFEWTPPPGTRHLTLADPSRSVIAAWTVAGVSGRPELHGPSSGWDVTTTGQPGYVVDEDYWREPPGTVSASVLLSVSQTANVELWDDTTGALLERQTVTDTDGATTVHLSARVPVANPSTIYSGWGSWRITPKPPDGQLLEVRVWSPGGGDKITVSSVSMNRTGAL
jgi:hypothetical protein